MSGGFLLRGEIGQTGKQGPQGVKGEKGIGAVTVSPIGLADGCPIPNNNANFGPDTPGTTTCGIQEAINEMRIVNPGILQGNLSIGTEQASGCIQLLPGVFHVKSQIELYSGLTLQGSGRLSSTIYLSDQLGTWIDSMDAILNIGPNQNEVTIEGLSVYGVRTAAYEPYNIDGIRVVGYNWRPTIRDVEIVNCQGIGIHCTGGSGEQIVYELCINFVSIQSCNAYGILLTYCADDTIFETNIQHCSGTGIAYYGGNGNWVKLHVFHNDYGIRIGGQPLQLVQPILDANDRDGLTVIAIDETQSAGGILILAPLCQSNGNLERGTSAGIRLVDAKNVVILGLDSENRYDQLHQAYALVEQGISDNNIVDCGIIQNMTAADPFVIVGAHTSLSRIVNYNNKLDLKTLPLDEDHRLVTDSQIAYWDEKQAALTTEQIVSPTDRTTWDGKQDALTADQIVSADDRTTWDAKQDALTTDQIVSPTDRTNWNAKQDALTSDQLVSSTDRTSWDAKQEALETSQLVSSLDRTTWDSKQDLLTDSSVPPMKWASSDRATPGQLDGTTGTIKWTWLFGPDDEVTGLAPFYFLALADNFSVTGDSLVLTFEHPIQSWMEFGNAGTTMSVSNAGITFAEQSSHSGCIALAGFFQHDTP